MNCNLQLYSLKPQTCMKPFLLGLSPSNHRYIFHQIWFEVEFFQALHLKICYNYIREASGNWWLHITAIYLLIMNIIKLENIFSTNNVAASTRSSSEICGCWASVLYYSVILSLINWKGVLLYKEITPGLISTRCSEPCRYWICAIRSVWFFTHEAGLRMQSSRVFITNFAKKNSSTITLYALKPESEDCIFLK